jgi:predicted house-cleaning noncanonical NTP pyrophosphatase (MazG superfamily)
MKTFTTIFFVSLGMFFCGCIPPEPVITLTPAEQEVRWECGVGLMDKYDKGVSILAGFIENDNGLLSFDVTIKNESQHSVLVDPKYFECQPHSKYEPGSSRQEQSGILAHAVDPEIKMQQLDSQLAEEHANFQSSNSIAAVGTMLDIVSHVASIFSPLTDEQREVHRRQDEDTKVRMDDQQARHISTVEWLRQEKSFWQTQPVRKTTLLPQESIRGRVFFHLQKAKFLKLGYPIGEAYIEMWFKQDRK